MPRSVASHKNKLKERFFSSGDFAAGLCRWWSQSGLLSDEDLRRSGHGGSNIPGVVSSLSCCHFIEFACWTRGGLWQPRQWSSGYVEQVDRLAWRAVGRSFVRSKHQW